MSGIRRSKEKWGVLLTAQPFGEGKFADMKIEAEIARPGGGRGAVTTRFAFTRLPIAEKFTRTEMMAWVEAHRAIMDASNTETEKLRRTANGFEVVRKMPTRKPAKHKRKVTAAK